MISRVYKLNESTVWFFVSMLVVFLTVYFLVTGSEVMTIALDQSDSIPLGTFITWSGLIAFPLMIYSGVKGLRRPVNNVNGLLARILKIIIGLSILWLPISYLLAGNISFNFSSIDAFQGGPTAMKLFWIFSYGIPIGSVFIIALYWMARLFNRQKY